MVDESHYEEVYSEGVGPPKNESEVEKDQMKEKEDHTSEKGLATLLTTEESGQREEVAPRNQEKRKRHLEKRG